ncbi:MAG: RHS repeat protein [Planctomycetota bacterium]|nr:RHS repeat protein [Planctomycetota bacterium]
MDNLGNTRRNYYDSKGLLRYTTDANAPISGTILDLATFYLWDAQTIALLPNPSLPINADGNRTDFGYDLLSRRIYTKQYLKYPQTSRSNFVLTILEWDDNSRLTAQIDDNRNRTEYFYDSKDRRVKTRYADGTETTILYHRNDTIYQRIDGNGTVATNYYDPSERLINRQITLGPYAKAGNPEYQTTFEHFEYDYLGRIIKAEDNDTSVELSYDSLGNTLKEKQTVGNSHSTYSSAFDESVSRIVENIYDGSGNRLCLYYPHPESQPPEYEVSYNIDHLNRIYQINLRSNASISVVAHYTYIGSGYRTLEKQQGNQTDNQKRRWD